MSVKVNLLPEDVKQRGQASRSRIALGVVALVLLAALGAVSLLQRGSISDAEEQLATVESQNATLRADVAALQPFADLEARANDSIDQVLAALGNESSVATILQDLSAVLPPTAELNQLSLNLPGAASAPAPGGDRAVYGSLTASGRVLADLAPGLERLVIDLERVAAFDNVFVTTSVIDDEGIVSFNLEIELGPEILTDRYAALREGGDA